MASRKAFLLFFVNLFVSWVSATPLAGGRVLAVIEEQYDNAKYSQFLMDLRGKAPVNFFGIAKLTYSLTPGRGYDVKLESAKKDTLMLLEHGDKVWDHVILFPPKSKGDNIPLLSCLPQTILTGFG